MKKAAKFANMPWNDLQECEIFGTKVLPQLKTVSLAQEYGRVPAQTPPTPLGTGVDK